MRWGRAASRFGPLRPRTTLSVSYAAAPDRTTPTWDVSPHPQATDRERPGSFREHDIQPFPDGMTPSVREGPPSAHLGCVFAARETQQRVAACLAVGRLGELSHRHAGEVAKAGRVSGHDRPRVGAGGRGDEEVVCSSSATGGSRVGEQLGVGSGDA